MIRIKMNKDGSYSIKAEDLPKSRKAIKLSFPVTFFDMSEEFEVDTPHGKAKGKAGDKLMLDIDGNMYPCAEETFKKSYVIVGE